MGYTITIGNAALKFDQDDLYLRIDVEGAEHPDAPAHCRFTGNGNSRSPSYTTWHEFCQDAGIYPLFYGQGWDRDARRYRECPEGFHRETPLLVEHPGCQPICHADLGYITAARIRREQTNGGKPAGFFESIGGCEIDNGTDHTLARLLWLEFWVRWALENCTIPAVGNT